MLELFYKIKELFDSNQMLVAGVGTAMTGFILYSLKAIPLRIWSLIKKFSTITFEVTTKDKYYQKYLNLISQNKSFLTRNFSESNKEITNGYGISYSFYKKRFCIVRRSIIEKSGSYNIEEQLNITLLTRSKKILQKFIDEATSKECSNSVSFTNISPSGSYKTNTILKRSFDSVFIDKEIKEKIKEKISWFIENREWYLQRGIPYKLSIMFYGPPGTGKTSILRAIVSYFEKTTYYLESINSISHIGKNSFYDDDEDEDDKKTKDNKISFVIIEDVDRIIDNKSQANVFDDEDDYDISRDFSDEEENMNLGGLLLKRAKEKEKAEAKKATTNGSAFHNFINSLDGFQLNEGSIFLFTANNINKLDSAFLRDGRIDFKIEIPELKDSIIKEMILNYFSLENHDLLNNIVFKPQIGATIQKELMNNNTIEEVIEKLEKE